MVRHLVLTSIAIVLFCELLFCQTEQVEIGNWKREVTSDWFGQNGTPVLFPSHANVLGHGEWNRLIGIKSPLGKQNQMITSDTGTFQPVTGPYGGTVRSFALDSGGWLFIATDGEIYRSTDNGSHWDMHLFPSQLHNSVEPVTVLGPNLVVAETDFSNFVSTDRGDSWNYLFEDVHGFAVDTNGEIYAGSNYGGVKKSTDIAKSWMPFALAGKKIWKVVLCGEGKFACPSDSGTYYSDDTGNTWIFRPYETQFTWNLVSDKRGHLFVLRYYDQDFQLYRSSDFGESWQRIVLPIPGDAYRIYVENDGRIIAPVGTNIVISMDAGDTWTALDLGMEALTVGRDATGNLLAGSFYGVYRRNETNGQWQELNNGIRAASIGQIEFTSTGSMIVFGLAGQCFRSTDGGMNWSRVFFGSTVEAYPPLLLCSSGSIFAAASLSNHSESGLLRSTDDGISWEWISLLSNYYSIYGITEGASGDILAATSFGDIYRSTNEGNSWSRVISSTTETQIKCIAADKAGNYYAAKDTSVLVSNDGVVWKRISLRRNYASWESISIDIKGEVFLGSSYNGVYHSSDTGKSWNLMNSGLYDRYVMSTTSDDSGNVVLGTASGVFRLADSVDNWLRFGNELPRTFTTCLSISPAGLLFAGTQNFGIYKTVAPMGSRIPRIEPSRPPPSDQIIDFSLYQNYPNPFNDQTVIRYEVPSPAKVELKIYNILGQVISTLISLELPKGSYNVGWIPKQLASGLYFCEMKALSASRTYSKIIKVLYLR